MGFGRIEFDANGNRQPRPSRGGDGLMANLAPHSRVAETDETLSVANIDGGLVQQNTTLTSNVTYTLPTAALILAENSYAVMDVGDSYSFFVTNAQASAFDVILAVGVGITAIGANNSLQVGPRTSRVFTLVRTGVATFDLY